MRPGQCAGFSGPVPEALSRDGEGVCGNPGEGTIVMEQVDGATPWVATAPATKSSQATASNGVRTRSRIFPAAALVYKRPTKTCCPSTTNTWHTSPTLV